MNLFAITHNLIRPKTLIASVSPVLLSGSWALKRDCFQFPLFLLLLATALNLQILSNIANDYFDGLKGTDTTRIGPLRLTAQNSQLAGVVKKFLYVSFIITLSLGVVLSIIGGPLIAAIFALSIITAIVYTAGPWAISYKGKAEGFAFAFFGPIPTFFAAYIFSHTYSLSSLLIGFLPGCYSLILITLNNLRDYNTDKAHNKKTLIVKYGQDFGKKMIKYALITIVLSVCILSYFQPKMIFSLILLPEMGRYFYLVNKSQTTADFITLFKKTGPLYTLSTIIWICFYMI